jgi:hypothetical protein
VLLASAPFAVEEHDILSIRQKTWERTPAVAVHAYLLLEVMALKDEL